MPSNIGYPKKTRSIAIGQAFPARTRSAGVNAGMVTKSPTPGPEMDSGKAPRKGLLLKGGAHG